MTSIRELAARLHKLERGVRNISNQPQLAYSSIEDGAIAEYEDDTLVQVIGTQHDGTHTTASMNGPVPPVPTAPTVLPVGGGATVRWHGTFVDDALVPMDFSRVEIHAYDTSGTLLSMDTLYQTIETPQGLVPKSQSTAAASSSRKRSSPVISR